MGYRTFRLGIIDNPLELLPLQDLDPQLLGDARGRRTECPAMTQSVNYAAHTMPAPAKGA